MSTTHVARHRIRATGGPSRIRASVILAAALSCLVVFAASFAVGRALSPKPAPGGPSSAHLDTLVSDTAVPSALSAAPALAERVPVAARRVTRHHRAASVVSVSNVPTLEPTPVPTGVSEATVEPASPAEVASPAVSSPATSSPTHSSSPSQSFDSSG